VNDAGTQEADNLIITKEANIESDETTGIIIVENAAQDSEILVWLSLLILIFIVYNQLLWSMLIFFQSNLSLYYIISSICPDLSLPSCGKGSHSIYA
jgi:hypothetical protein